jgi:hypothetical protein
VIGFILNIGIHPDSRRQQSYSAFGILALSHAVYRKQTPKPNHDWA